MNNNTITENSDGFYLPGDKPLASSTAHSCTMGTSTKEALDIFPSNLTQTWCLFSGLETQNTYSPIPLLSLSSYLARCHPSSDPRHCWKVASTCQESWWPQLPFMEHLSWTKSLKWHHLIRLRKMLQISVALLHWWEMWAFRIKHLARSWAARQRQRQALEPRSIHLQSPSTLENILLPRLAKLNRE